MVSLAQVSPTLEGRYTNTQRHIHSKFDQGMIRDVASWELPEGGMYDAADCLCDFVGKVRKRGGSTSPAAGNSAATVENLLNYKSSGVDALTAVYGSLGKGGALVNQFNTSTGASTNFYSIGTVNTFACRPFQHNNLAVFPFQALASTNNDRNVIAFAGGATAAGFAVTAATVTANDNRITGIAPTSLTAGMLGSIIELDNLSVPGTHIYIGRITEITSSSAIRVEPMPTLSFTATQGRVSAATGLNGEGGGALWNAITSASMTGRFGLSYQNRIVLGYTISALTASTLNVGIQPQPNRVVWTQLQTEAFPGSGSLPDGDVVMYPGIFSAFNFVDIPGLEGMTGLAAAGEGQLVVFGPRKTYRISGTLATETVANPSFTFSVDQISANVGIQAPISTLDRPDRSIQYTPEGLIFAGANGIYVYDGSEMKPLLQGKNARYYQDRRRAGNVIHGSFFSLPKNHYYLSMSGSDGGLMINLETLAMTRFTNIDCFDAVPDPADATKLWGARWWDTTGAAPTMTKGQLIGLESIWLPTSANKNDADGTAVIADIQSASYVDGEVSQNKLPVDVNMTYKLAGSGSPTATLKADTKLDTSDASYVTIDSGVLTATTTTSKNWDEIGPLLADGQAVEFRVTTNVACDTFELDVLDIGLHHGPPGFST